MSLAFSDGSASCLHQAEIYASSEAFSLTRLSARSALDVSISLSTVGELSWSLERQSSEPIASSVFAATMKTLPYCKRTCGREYR